MSEARSTLRSIVDELRNHGVSNEVRIAEYVAFFLLVLNEWEKFQQQSDWRYDSVTSLQNWFNERHKELIQETGLPVPEPPLVHQWGEHAQSVIFYVINYLRNALAVSPHNQTRGAFFQREIRFELLKATSGSQYPTPHHIATLMAQLAVTDATEKVLDPTAGTGGLLVAAHAENKNAQLSGVDFDSQWTRLASTNLILNGATNASMKAKQALELHDIGSYMTARSYEYYKDRWEYRGEFDAVLMNPPFGGTRNPYELGASVGTEFGRTSSTVLAVLALRMLKIGGIAAFLQPSGVLFGRGGEAHLRHVLMQEYVLEAIITLPPDAMQPYSQVATHLLVARNTVPETNHSVWFLTLVSDGYPAGTARDLTAEPNAAQNDLPRARDIVLKSRADQWKTRLTLDTYDVQTVKLGRELPGLGIRITTEPENIKWRVSHLSDGVLVKLRNAEDALLGWFYEPYRADSVLSFPVTDVQQFNWKDRLSQDTWEINELSTWQASSDNVTVEVNPKDQQVTLQREKAKFEFSSDKNAKLSASACLLNEQGKQITPWISITDEKRESDIKGNSFGGDVGAAQISDAQGNRIGWLLDLTLTKDDQEHQATLVIIIEPVEELFTKDGDFWYALIDDGWLKITPDGYVSTQIGSPVRLRDKVTKGFAIGPAASSEDVNYSLFGVLIPSPIFVHDGKVGDMRPSSFLPEPETAPLGHPLDVLANIRRSQTQLSGKVDSLLGILGQSGRYDDSAETLAAVPEWIAVMLSNQQRQLLELLKRQVIDNRPRHFNELDVERWCNDAKITYGVDDIQQQLRLFIRLGLVKAVHTNGHNLYRMITTADVQQAME